MEYIKQCHLLISLFLLCFNYFFPLLISSLLERNLATNRINDFFGFYLNYGKLPGHERQRINRALHEDIRIINNYKKLLIFSETYCVNIMHALGAIRVRNNTNLSKITIKYLYEKSSNQKVGLFGVWQSAWDLKSMKMTRMTNIIRSEMRDERCNHFGRRRGGSGILYVRPRGGDQTTRSEGLWSESS